MKKLAAAMGGKSAEMMKPAEAERVTRLQDRRRQPVRPDPAAENRDRRGGAAEPYVFINAGQRGLQVRLAPRDVAALLEAVVAPLTA